uniref:Uncharacterized protein n=1 Tax=Oryza meridionalis TaxID=40149 RepID=A0A0E0DDI1_9ORYZ
MAGGGAMLAAVWEIAVVFVLRPLLAFAFFPLVQEIAGLRRKKPVKPKPKDRGRFVRFNQSLDERRTAVVKQQPREIQKSTNTLNISRVPSPSDSETDEPAMAFTSSRGVAATAPASIGGGAAVVLGEGNGGPGLLRGAWSRRGASPVSWPDAGAEVEEDAVHRGGASKARSRLSTIFGDFACVDEEKHRGKYVISQVP